MKRWLTSEEYQEWLRFIGKKPKKGSRKWRTQKQAREHFGSQRKDREERCRAYLPDFLRKLVAAKDTESRLRLLKQAANPPWERVHPKLLRILRKEYQKKFYKLLAFEIDECPICQMEAASEKHHIIPLTFGGISEDANLVKICMSCHNAIHPWMK